MDNQATEPMDLQSGAAALAGLMDEPKDQQEVEAVEPEAGEEAAAETEEGQEPEPTEDDLPLEAKYTVKINGEEKHVTLDEMRKGYMMQADYTKKTTELATERQQIEQKIRAEVSQAYTQQLQQMNALLTAAVKQDQQIDWAKLAEEDPAEYVRQSHQAQQRQNALIQLQQRQEQEANRNLAETLAQEHSKLLERRPEWKDSKKAQEDIAAMRGYLAKDYGFSEDEISSVIDSRQLDIVWKASQYDKLQAAKPAVTKKVEKLPVKVERPGVSSDGRGTKSAIDKLRRSGSVDDGAAAIRGLMG